MTCRQERCDEGGCLIAEASAWDASEDCLTEARMSGCHEESCSHDVVDPKFEKVLWVALVVNAVMFVVEVVAGVGSDSVSLLADAVDFAGDAANYGISLAVLSRGISLRAMSALLKGCSMIVFGLFVLGRSVWLLVEPGLPEPMVMGAVGFLGLLANGVVTWILYAYRRGDADMRSVWLCSRNDMLGNIAVLLAAGGVFGLSSGLPDVIVGLVMSALALWSGVSVVRHALSELGRKGVKGVRLN